MSFPRSGRLPRSRAAQCRGTQDRRPQFGPLDRNRVVRAGGRNRQPEPRRGGAGPCRTRLPAATWPRWSNAWARAWSSATRAGSTSPTRPGVPSPRKGILAELKDAEATVNATALAPTGTLRITASLSFAMQHIAPLLPEYTGRYPERDGARRDRQPLPRPDRQQHRRGHPHARDGARLEHHHPAAGETRRILAASPATWRARPAAPLDDLQHHKMLVYTYANNPHELRFTRDGEVTTVP
jgi:hypothetical protein